MQIENATVYSTEDIETLVRVVGDAINRLRRLRSKRAGNPLPSYIEPPETLVIGYFNPKALPAEALYSSGKGMWSRVTSQLRGKPRLGIVKLERMPLAPLVMLAQCAEGAERKLPYKVVQDMASVLASVFTRDFRVVRDFNTAGFANLVEEVPEVRYGFKVDKTAKERAARVRRKNLLETTLRDLSYAESRVDRYRDKLDAAEDRLADLKLRAVKLKRKVEEDERQEREAASLATG